MEIWLFYILFCEFFIVGDLFKVFDKIVKYFFGSCINVFGD